MYERGIVSAVDVATHRVRARLPQKQDVETGWLDVLVRATHQETDFGLPKVDTQVALMLDEALAGCVLGAVYSEADPPPALAGSARRFTFVDGSYVEHDAVSGRTTIHVTGELHLAGGDDFIALAGLVLSELQSVRSELGSHVHPAGAMVAGPVPVTGVTSPATIGWTPSSVASGKAKSA